MLYSIKILQNTLKENQSKKVFFVTKKKNCKKAVDRNRIKRIARNAFKEVLKKINTNMPVSLIFFLEHDMIQEEYSKIVKCMYGDVLSLIKNKI